MESTRPPHPAEAPPEIDLPEGGRAGASRAEIFRVEASASPAAVPPTGRSAVGNPAGLPRTSAGTARLESAYVRRVRPALGALIVAALAAPVAAATAVIALLQLAVERSPRRVFFVQQRAGKHGRPFRMLKFRTLRPAADGSLVPTRLGRTLRRTHLDELPQLWNVVRGEMSLIGPRPEAVEVEAWAEEQLPGFGERLAIAPGITGLAQVVQDSTPLDVELYREKLRLNRRYLSRVSFALDVWILARTALRPLRPRQFGPSKGPT